MNHQKRLEKLQKALNALSCDAMIIEEMINLYYMTGIEMSAGKLLVDQKGATLIVDSRYFELCKKRSPFPVVLESESILPNLLKSSIIKLAFDSDTTSFLKFLDLENLVDKINKESKRNQPLVLVPANNPVLHIRTIKDHEEIELLRKAATLGSEGFDYVCSLLKEGVTEVQLATELEIFWKRKGSKKLAFDPIIAFGANSSMPHYRSGQGVLKKGQPVLIDIGVNLEGYHSDMTRVVFFGKPNPKLEEIYIIVKDAQERALKLCRPGTLIGDLDTAARNYIDEKGYGENFSHNLGHGVGLEIHELPSLKNKPPFRDQPLEEGMVITIEPGIYLPDIGGVRIEDTVVITPSGHENLTKRSKAIEVF